MKVLTVKEATDLLKAKPRIDNPPDHPGWAGGSPPSSPSQAGLENWKGRRLNRLKGALGWRMAGITLAYVFVVAGVVGVAR